MEGTMAEKQRVGLIGLGSIGLDLVELVNERARDDIELIGAIVKDTSRTDRPLPVFRSAAELLARRPDVVVEMAGHEGLREHGPAVLAADVDLLFIAVGALADPDFEREFRAAAEASRARARIASGAIGALDAIAGAAMGGLERVTHTVRKPPSTLLVPEEAAKLSGPKEIFRGNAREAALAYPESVNVTAAVSFAGIGLDRTEVVMLVDPAVDRNVHTVEAEGTFGSLRFEIRNIPSRRNPKSGSLVAMSILQQLLARRAAISVG
jgi:aspartate dehydrogenase